MHEAGGAAQGLGQAYAQFAESAQANTAAKAYDRRFADFAFFGDMRERSSGGFFRMRNDPLGHAPLGRAEIR